MEGGLLIEFEAGGAHGGRAVLRVMNGHQLDRVGRFPRHSDRDQVSPHELRQRGHNMLQGVGQFAGGADILNGRQRDPRLIGGFRSRSEQWVRGRRNQTRRGNGLGDLIDGDGEEWISGQLRQACPAGDVRVGQRREDLQQTAHSQDEERRKTQACGFSPAQPDADRAQCGECNLPRLPNRIRLAAVVKDIGHGREIVPLRRQRRVEGGGGDDAEAGKAEAELKAIAQQRHERPGEKGQTENIDVALQRRDDGSRQRRIQCRTLQREEGHADQHHTPDEHHDAGQRNQFERA